MRLREIVLKKHLIISNELDLDIPNKIIDNISYIYMNNLRLFVNYNYKIYKINDENIILIDEDDQVFFKIDIKKLSYFKLNYCYRIKPDSGFIAL